ncbi:uncharacterized protein LOC142826883 [Pelodiscus sinensis]|uniref:uncharacterized protein LOC142826883 n=1 Tax=Pelodiscus sinensis TaxID=13735 RepID=UPI003F6AE4E2
MAAPGGHQQPAPFMLEAPRGMKRCTPSWSPAEIEALLDLWADEEALHDPCACRQDTSMRPPVTRHNEAGDEAELPTGAGSEEDEDDQGSTVTLHLETVSGSPDVSLASLETRNGSSAGPARREGPSSPTAAAAPPTAQAPGWWVRQWDQLLRRHVQAVERIKAAITRRVDADLEWHQQPRGHFQAQCDRTCDAITTLTAHIGHVVHYGMALPHAPAIPPAPMPPPLHPILPTSPCCLPRCSLKAIQSSVPTEAVSGDTPPTSRSHPSSQFRASSLLPLTVQSLSLLPLPVQSPLSSPSQFRTPDVRGACEELCEEHSRNMKSRQEAPIALALHNASKSQEKKTRVRRLNMESHVT